MEEEDKTEHTLNLGGLVPPNEHNLRYSLLKFHVISTWTALTQRMGG
jgi:hypothetical protein